MGAAIPVIEAVGAAYSVGKVATAGHGGMLASFFGNSPPPKPGAPPPMPDQNSILQASQLQASKDAAMRYGRAATILSTNATTGDKLGP